MRSKIRSFLGRTVIKSSKLKPLVSLAISRIAVLKHQRQARCSQSRSDVVQLLHQGNHQRALLRVEQVMKDQNMLDVYDMLEGYCNLLIERVHLIEHERECPDELREATSSMVYAASRCGDFPELQEIRALLTAHFGKEFAARSVELRNNCGVSHTMIQKLSTRQASLESRMSLLKELASENSIVLQLEEGSVKVMDNNLSQKQGNEERPKSDDHDDHGDHHGDHHDHHYKDVADAAQAAFESAANAAAAARAAVELSRFGQDRSPRGPPLRPPPPPPSPPPLSAREEEEEEEEEEDKSKEEEEEEEIHTSDSESVTLNLDRMPLSVRTRRF